MALKRQDFILNKNGDFPLQDTVIGGRWLPTQYGDSDQQHIKDRIFYMPGYLKFSPLTGFGIRTYSGSENASQRAFSKLSTEMERGGYIVRQGAVVPVKGGNFKIDTSFIERK